MSTLRYRVVIAVLVALILTPPLGGARPADAQDANQAVDLYHGVLPERQAEVAGRVGPIDIYRIDGAFDPDAATIVGRVDVRVVNRRAEPVGELYLRLYPNDPSFLEAEMTVERVRAGKENLQDPAAHLSVEGTVLRVPLAEPLAPLDDVLIRVEFTTSLMTGPFDLGSFLGQDAWSGTWLLMDWHPVVAPYLDGIGWYLDPLSAETGPAVFENALYDVTLTAPDKLVAIATGTEVEWEEKGRLIERRWVTGPVRGFVVVADDDYSELTEESGGTLVSAYADWANGAMVNYARIALGIAVDALEAYGERFGPYPYGELDVVVLPYLGGSGFAVPGMIFVSMYYGEATDPNAPNWYEPDRLFFEHAVAHEVGHQWWGMSIDADTRRYSYLIEGLTNYLAVEFRAWTDGDEAAAEVLDAVIVEPYVAMLGATGDHAVDRTEGGGLPEEAHVQIVYGKGALGYLALHLAIGDEAFYAALADYAAEFAFGITQPEDLLSAFETASGQELDDLWRHWFLAAETTEAEVLGLIRAA